MLRQAMTMKAQRIQLMVLWLNYVHSLKAIVLNDYCIHCAYMQSKIQRIKEEAMILSVAVIIVLFHDCDLFGHSS
jgi:hypothetical protein